MAHPQHTPTLLSLEEAITVLFLAKRRGAGSLRQLTVFVRYENVVRLLRFLGYCLE